MHDQADELRQLVQRGAVPAGAAATERSRLIVVTGGKGGVGTTVVSVALATALARIGPTLLVDGDFDHADATLVCGIEPQTSVADVLAGRCHVRDAIEPGPGGLAVLPGGWPAQSRTDTSALAQGRLLSGLVALSAEFESIVIDAGNGLARRVQRFWNAADQALLVTTPDLTAVMDTYAALKLLVRDGALVPADLVVNRVPPGEADDVYRRLAQSARRFLGIDLGLAGSIADSTSFATEAGRRRELSQEPYAAMHPAGLLTEPAGQRSGIDQVARRVFASRRSVTTAA